jgi:ATP-binding cassette subfamily A (ABC1) protein 1
VFCPEANLSNTILIDFSVKGKENAHTEESGSSEAFHLDSSEKLKGRKLIAQQLKALYVKRFCNSKRNVKGFFCEV